MTGLRREWGRPEDGWNSVETEGGIVWASDLVAPASVLWLPVGVGGLWLDRLDPTVAAAFQPPASPNVDEQVATQALAELYDRGGTAQALDAQGSQSDRVVLRALFGALALVGDLDGAERRDTQMVVSGWFVDELELRDEIAVLCGRAGAESATVDEVVRVVTDLVLDSWGADGFVVPDARIMSELVQRVAGQPLPVPRTARRIGLVREPHQGDEDELSRALSDVAVDHAVAGWDRVGHVLGGTAVASLGPEFYALRLLESWAARGADLLRIGNDRLARVWLALARDGYGQVGARTLDVGRESPGAGDHDLAEYLDACQEALGTLCARLGGLQADSTSPVLSSTATLSGVTAGPLTATEFDALSRGASSSPLSHLDELDASGDAVVFLRLGRWVGWWDPAAPWRPIEVVELDGFAERVAASGDDAVAVHPDGRLSLLRMGTPNVVAVVELGEAVASVAARPRGGFVVGCASGAVVAVEADGAVPARVLWDGQGTAAPIKAIGCFEDGAVYAVSESGQLWIDGRPIDDVVDLVRGELPGVVVDVEIRCVATSPDGNRVAVGLVADDQGCCVVLPRSDAGVPIVLPDGRHPTAIAFTPGGDNSRVYVGDSSGTIHLMGPHKPRLVRPRSPGRAATPDVEVLAIEALDVIPGAVATFADGSVWSIQYDAMEPIAMSASGPIWSLTSLGTRVFGLTEFGDLLALSYEPEMLAAPVPVVVEPDAAGDLSISLGRPGVAGVLRWSPAPGIELCIDRTDGLLVAATVDAEATPASVQTVFGSSLSIDELAVLVDESNDVRPVTGWALRDLLCGWCRVGLLRHDEDQTEPDSLAHSLAELERRYRELALEDEVGPDGEALVRLDVLVSDIRRLLGTTNLPEPAQRRLNRCRRLLEHARPDIRRVNSLGFAGAAATLAPIEPLPTDASPLERFGRLHWDGVNAHAELAAVTLEAVKSGEQFVVTAQSVDPAAPHATVAFRFWTLLASMVHLRRDGDLLTGRSSALWPWPTDAYIETTEEPRPLTVDTADLLFAIAGQALDLERRVTARDEDEEAGSSPGLASAWDRVAVEWEAVAHRSLTDGLAWVAAAAAQRAWTAYLLALARSDGQRLACHGARWAGAEGRRMAALLDVGRRATNPLWVPAWAAATDDGTQISTQPQRS